MGWSGIMETIPLAQCLLPWYEASQPVVSMAALADCLAGAELQGPVFSRFCKAQIAHTPTDRPTSYKDFPYPQCTTSLGVAKKFSLPLPGLGATSVFIFESPGNTYHLVVVAVGDVGLLEKGAEGCLQRERLCLLSKTCPTITVGQSELRSCSVCDHHPMRGAIEPTVGWMVSEDPDSIACHHSGSCCLLNPCPQLMALSCGFSGFIMVWFCHLNGWQIPTLLEPPYPHM